MSHSPLNMRSPLKPMRSSVSVSPKASAQAMGRPWNCPLDCSRVERVVPEHFGLNTQSDPDVLANTRTISASRFAQWLTNYNNLHTAHHYHQGVPMARIEDLHALIADRVVTVESSYWHFYRSVLTGRIRYQQLDETCMTR